MEKPVACQDELYDYMKLCWCFKASDRPTFKELVRKLLPYARADFQEKSFYHSVSLSESESDEEVIDPSTKAFLSETFFINEYYKNEHESISNELVNHVTANHVSRASSSLPLD